MSFQAPQGIDRTHGLGQVRVAGAFLCNGTSNPTVVRGKGFTVQRTGVGIYTVSLTSSYLSMIVGLTGVNNASAGYMSFITTDQVSDANAPSFVINGYAIGGGVVDLGSPARVCFDLVLATDSNNK